MKQSEIIKKISEQIDMHPGAVKECVNMLIKELTEVMRTSDNVNLIGFGTFSGRKQHKRMVRNPITGETMIIPVKIVPKFKPSQNLKNRVGNLND